MINSSLKTNKVNKAGRIILFPEKMASYFYFFLKASHNNYFYYAYPLRI